MAVCELRLTMIKRRRFRRRTALWTEDFDTPVSVASVCRLTWFCARGNIHATTKGYTLIGKLVVARYRTVRRG